jgi:hypothetical protein
MPTATQVKHSDDQDTAEAGRLALIDRDDPVNRQALERVAHFRAEGRDLLPYVLAVVRYEGFKGTVADLRAALVELGVTISTRRLRDWLSRYDDTRAIRWLRKRGSRISTFCRVATGGTGVKEAAKSVRIALSKKSVLSRRPHARVSMETLRRALTLKAKGTELAVRRVQQRQRALSELQLTRCLRAVSAELYSEFEGETRSAGDLERILQVWARREGLDGDDVPAIRARLRRMLRRDLDECDPIENADAYFVAALRRLGALKEERLHSEAFRWAA